MDNIIQLDGNVTFAQNDGELTTPTVRIRQDRIETALNLPVVAPYNMRSLFPKVGNFKTDMLERGIDVAFVSEVWEQSEKKEHANEIERMLEIDGLKYLSHSRPSYKKGGGVALIINQDNFTCDKLDVFTPDNLEVIWGLLKPKASSAKYSKIVVCTFYFPPNARVGRKLADHLVGTLQMLCSRYPDCGIIMGADKNSLNIQPILNCGLNLKQMVDKATINGKILDICITNLSKYYNSPIIVPPVGPDDPTKGKLSDHWVPVCIPHTDRYNPPHRTWKLHTFRPLPDSNVRNFGQWITGEDWDSISKDLSPTEQALMIEKLIEDNLNKYCPEKTVKIGSQDKAWITGELKTIHRRRQREYNKYGKSAKYKRLDAEFVLKYKLEAKKFIVKNVESLKECNPGKAFNTLKKLGARPGDCTDSGGFTLPGHSSDKLTDQQSAERIADHFAEISNEFPPISVANLPGRVQSKLILDESPPPEVSPEQVWEKMKKAKKPKSGVPGDLPRLINKEFSVELSVPLSELINNISRNATWPTHWKREYVTPLAKIANPETEDDLRPISLTPFFSKVTEHFVVMWLLEYVEHLIDFRQYGGIKGNSICHYLIELVNFILSNQEGSSPTAILACMIDFSKAFNRINHNIVVTKLSDMGVPAWLLRIVMAFLADRSMVVRYKGATSRPKNLPGGGPQGTLLGLLLFLVLINDAGFLNQSNNVGQLITGRKAFKAANEIHLKFVDDLTLAESIDLKEKCIEVPDRPRPDQYHARTGHALLPGCSKLFKQIEEVKSYAVANEMKINSRKTKFMLFNNCRNLDFMPKFNLENDEIELLEEMKILGVVFSSDMKWHANTANLVDRAYSRVWILRRLKNLGTGVPELLDVYRHQIRSILELAAPVWHSSLTLDDRTDIERVQKSSLQIILGDRYLTYKNALQTANLKSLEQRRNQLCLKFTSKAVKNPKHRNWFKVNKKVTNTRQSQPTFCPVFSRTVRFQKSPISFMTNLLNSKYSKSKV